MSSRHPDNKTMVSKSDRPRSHLSQFKGFPVLLLVRFPTMMAEEAITRVAMVTAQRRWNPPRIGRESLVVTVYWIRLSRSARDYER